MATIMRNDEQVQALEFIDSAIAEVKLLNAMILGNAEGCKIVCRLGKRNGTLDVDRRFTKNVISVLKEQRKARVREIGGKLQKFKMIQLSDEEAAVISDEAIVQKTMDAADAAAETDEQDENTDPPIDDTDQSDGDDDPTDKEASVSTDEDDFYEDNLFSGNFG